MVDRACCADADGPRCGGTGGRSTGGRRSGRVRSPGHRHGAGSPGDARGRRAHHDRRRHGGGRLASGLRGHPVHAVRARRGRTGDRAHRGARPLRRRGPVRVHAGARHQRERDRRPAHAARPAVVLGSPGRGRRLVLRPAHGLPVRGQPRRGEAGRLPVRRHRRGRWVGRGLGRRDRARRRGMERRIPHPLLPAALPGPRGADLGHQLPAPPRAPGRALGVGAHDPRRRGHRVAPRRAPRAAGSGSAAAAGGSALLADQPAARSRRRGRPLPSSHGRPGVGRRRPQVRGDLRHHPGRDRQPRLRAGRGGPRQREPDRVRDLPSGAPALLRRGRGHLQLRHRPGRRGRRRRIALLLAQNRARAPGTGGSAGRLRGRRRPDHHSGRLEALRKDGRRLVGRRAARDDRRGARRRRSGRGRPVPGARRAVLQPRSPQGAEGLRRRPFGGGLHRHHRAPGRRRGRGAGAQVVGLRGRRRFQAPLRGRRLAPRRIRARLLRDGLGGGHRANPAFARPLLPASRRGARALRREAHRAGRRRGRLRSLEVRGQPVASRHRRPDAHARLRGERPGLPARRRLPRALGLGRIPQLRAPGPVPQLVRQPQRLERLELRPRPRRNRREPQPQFPAPELLARIRGREPGARGLVRRPSAGRPAPSDRGRDQLLGGIRQRRPQAGPDQRQLLGQRAPRERFLVRRRCADAQRAAVGQSHLQPGGQAQPQPGRPPVGPAHRHRRPQLPVRAHRTDHRGADRPHGLRLHGRPLAAGVRPALRGLRQLQRVQARGRPARGAIRRPLRDRGGAPGGRPLPGRTEREPGVLRESGLQLQAVPLQRGPEVGVLAGVRALPRLVAGPQSRGRHRTVRLRLGPRRPLRRRARQRVHGQAQLLAVPVAGGSRNLRRASAYLDTTHRGNSLRERRKT